MPYPQIPSPHPVAILGPGLHTLDLAARCPTTHIVIFALSWEEVEDTRRLVESRHLCDRLSIHHHSTARTAGFPSTHTTRAA